MFLAVIAFCIKKNKYIVHPPGGSIVGDTFKKNWTAMKRSRKSERPIPRIKGESWLDRAKETRGGHFSNGEVEDVKALLRIIPIFAMFIIYWTLYSQMQTTYLIQAQYMKIRFGISFPAASLSIFDIVAVLILIPFMDKVVYPLLRYIGFKKTPLRRVGMGMLFAASSVAKKGCVEMERRGRFESGHTVKKKLFEKTFIAADMSIFYQVKKILLIGTSEVFTSITGLEFKKTQAPRCLQGLVMGVFLVTKKLGNYLSGALANIISYAQPHWSDDESATGNIVTQYNLPHGRVVGV
ncbi:Solute carrier family 15 member 4 [Exaiptasia diaphana]|nr:Solute carrier family 15 member 4 [Exaiptasia diaphana]